MTTRKKTPHYWEEAKVHLSKKDKTLKRIIESYQGETLTRRGDAFFSLARAIVGQQISVKAADTIWKRLETAAGDMKPELVLLLSAETLRGVGLSQSKMLYLLGLARYFDEHPKPKWEKMTDEEVIKELTALKGIGKWTAEMFLIFHLHRPDVFPIDDIGLQKGVERHYNKGEKLPKDKLLAFGERWRPYRSVATWYFWRSLDPVPVEY